MNFPALMIALVAERFLLPLEERRQPRWLREYFIWMRRLLFPFKGSDGPLGVLLVLLPLFLVFNSIQGLLDDLAFGVAGFLFSILVLLFCLGPRDLSTQVDAFLEAAYAGNQSAILDAAEAIAGPADLDGPRDTTRRVAQTVFPQAESRLFGVLFWFAVLGSLGAVLYRAADELHRQARQRDKPGSTFIFASARLLWILDWLPARLLASGLLLVGNFERGLYAWKDCSGPGLAEAGERADLLLECVGMAALRVAEPEEPRGHGGDSDPVLVQAAMGMVWRAVILWMTLLGLVQLGGWVL